MKFLKQELLFFFRLIAQAVNQGAFMATRSYLSTITAAVLLAFFGATWARAGFTGAEDIEYSLNSKFKFETLYGDRISLLNETLRADSIFYLRHTLDINFDLVYGNELFGCPVIEFMYNLRNKAIWGNPRSSIPVSAGSVNFSGINVLARNLFVPRLIAWSRELWISFKLEPLLGLECDHSLNLTLGAFPYQLGRGIALGDAYAVGQEFFGFFTDSDIDQYAFGVKFSGEWVPDQLGFDFYLGMLQNRSGSLSDTNDLVRANRLGFLGDPVRGFGIINYLVATQLYIEPFSNDTTSLILQPYALYNHEPEQEVEFLADASSELFTIGLAAEYAYNNFEFGFDTAYNFGHQTVHAWDRNQATITNREGVIVLTNNQVIDQNEKAVLFVSGPSQDAITEQAKKAELLSQSCQCPNSLNFNKDKPETSLIGTFDSIGVDQGPLTISNSALRFRNRYVNIYQGKMAVADAAYWFHDRQVQVAVTAAIATGDDDPNSQLIDGNFRGFIPLQEAYSGKRVRSAFVLGSQGKLRRPLSFADDVQVLDQGFAGAIGGFTDLRLVGAGLTWKPNSCWKWNVNPNILGFWQDFPPRKFDVVTKKELSARAHRFVGIEANIFITANPYPTLKLFLVASAFFPGPLFRDIRGKPLSKLQANLLKNIDTDPAAGNLRNAPNIGADNGYVVSFGFEYNF